MSSKWRRFEVLLPTRFDDGRDVPAELLADAVNEVVDRFDAVSFESGGIEGRWRSRTVLYRDDLARVVVDVPDKNKNRKWMRAYRARWQERLEQIEIWMVSYPIDVE